MMMKQMEEDIILYSIVNYMWGNEDSDCGEQGVNCKLVKKDHWKLDEISRLNKKQ